MKVLVKDKINTALNRLAENSQVYVPVHREGGSRFAPWPTVPGDELALDSLNTMFSPKEVVLPQTEKMYTFAARGQSVEIKETGEERKERVVFGVRACDSKAIAALDEVFLTRGYEDGFYKARREPLIIIGKACTQPGPNCFCSAMGVDPLEPDPVDVIIYDLGDAYGWEPRSERGQKLTQSLGDILADRDFQKPSAGEFQLQVDINGLPEKLAGMFEHPLWEELAEPCMNCGICTYLCPSCYCFDIQVKNRGTEGYRFRCWDSCMYPEYTMMAGGHNPRGSKHERFRNRFLHKLEFFKERYGTSLCTGCGRCIVACPQGINIVSIIKRLQEVELDVR